MQCCHNVDATFSMLQQRCVNIWSYYAWLRCALMAELIVPALRNISKRHLWDFDAPENMNSTGKISTTHTKRFRRGGLRDVASCSTLRIKCLDVWRKKIPKMSVWCSVFTTAYFKKKTGSYLTIVHKSSHIAVSVIMGCSQIIYCHRARSIVTSVFTPLALLVAFIVMMLFVDFFSITGKSYSLLEWLRCL